MTRSTSIRLAALAASILAAASCGSSPSAARLTATSSDPNMSSMSMSPERPSTHGVVSIVAPKDAQTLPAGDVDLVVELAGARLSTTTSTDLADDEGHLHVTLDDQLISMTSGLEQTIPDVAQGTHLLKVEFVANDHAPFEPRVVAAVAFEVKAA